MGQYSAIVEADTTVGNCLLAICSDGLILPELVELRLSFLATPDDERYGFALYYISDLGSGGTAMTPEKLGPCAASSAKVYKGFSTQPTKAGSAKLKLSPHRRAMEPWKAAFGEGIKPHELGNNKGLGIFVENAPSVITALAESIWFE